jgi:hypothetical protein
MEANDARALKGIPLAEEYPKIIASREASSMVSTWTEFLRLSKADADAAALEVCMYEGLGELDQPEDEGEEPIIPEEIDGKKVMGVDDGYIIFGGELLCLGEEKRLRYRKADLEKAVKWLEAKHWRITNNLVEELKRAVEF